MEQAPAGRSEIKKPCWVIEAYQIVLVPVDETHLEQLRSWRNNRVIRAQMLNGHEITKDQQVKWFQRIQADSSEYHWMVRYRGESIGSINLRCRDNEHLAVADTLWAGLYIGHSAYRGNLLAFAPALALYDFCFSHLTVKFLRAIVKPNNQAALNFNTRLGYKKIGTHDDAIEFMVDQKGYENTTHQLKNLLSRNARSQQAPPITSIKKQHSAN